MKSLVMRRFFRKIYAAAQRIGDIRALKMRFLRECWFESGMGHHQGFGFSAQLSGLLHARPLCGHENLSMQAARF